MPSGGRFSLFYVLTGIGAGLFFAWLNRKSTTPLVGASGAISGILAAYLLLRPCAKVSVFVLRFVVRVRAYWVIGGWMLLQLYQIANQATTESPTSHTAAGSLPERSCSL